MTLGLCVSAESSAHGHDLEADVYVLAPLIMWPGRPSDDPFQSHSTFY